MNTLSASLRAIALGTVLLLAGAAAPPATQTAPTPSEFPRFYDPSYRISMATPAFPVAKERTIIATFQGPSEDGFASNVTLLVDPGATTRDDYIKAFKDEIKETNPGHKMRPMVNLQVSGKDAAILDYDFSQAGRRLHFLQLVVFAEDRVYVLTCTAPMDTFKNCEAQFRKCIDTFRLEK